MFDGEPSRLAREVLRPKIRCEERGMSSGEDVFDGQRSWRLREAFRLNWKRRGAGGEVGRKNGAVGRGGLGAGAAGAGGGSMR